MREAAYRDVVWRYGPERRAQLIGDCLETLLHHKRFSPSDTNLVGARSIQWQFDIPDSEVLFERDQLCEAEVTVVVPLFNYANYVEEALDSVRNQDLSLLDLIIVEDRSTDNSLSVALSWAERWADRFNRFLLLRNRANSGLARTRNAGFDWAESPFILPLDADNRLRPRCCSVLLEALRTAPGTAFAYPILQCFGDRDNLIGDSSFDPVRLASGNYIDALALIGKWAWAAVGGYTHQWGWDDYDLWCSFVEYGFGGLQVPEILADYRVHERSMLRTDTDKSHRRREVARALERRHPWLRIPELMD
jgi:glycosyltransferase involved in cell wall biosynthesis